MHFFLIESGIWLRISNLGSDFPSHFGNHILKIQSYNMYTHAGAYVGYLPSHIPGSQQSSATNRECAVRMTNFFHIACTEYFDYNIRYICESNKGP